MAIHAEAGHLPRLSTLENIPALVCAYYTQSPTPSRREERVSFGTSGHRGSALKNSFNENHILAVSQAVCEYRQKEGVFGPLFLGFDTHALSQAAFRTAIEVLAANKVKVFVDPATYTATPVVSHAILEWNRTHPQAEKADGIVVTPSHNPPADGGFKYNPPHGGPADTDATGWIEKRANELLEKELDGVARMPYEAARKSEFVEEFDFVGTYVNQLKNIVDMDAIAASGLKIGVDPLGGASLVLWKPIIEKYGIPLTLVNDAVDPTFRFVARDKDGKIRMDCSSPWAMSSLLSMKDSFDLAFSCDPDSDRHGIVTKDGLMNPNHYLSVCAWYLLRTRTSWPKTCGVGKTAVTSDMLARVATSLGREAVEVPVGFKWFVPYLSDKTCGFCCEESAGASFLCFDGKTWSTDKDGPLLCLLAAEMMAKEKASPSELYRRLEARFGAPVYRRFDTPADERTRSAVKKVSPEDVTLKSVGGSAVTSVVSKAPGNGAPIGGVKVMTQDGWFAMRPSGTEPICKLYIESFKGEEHLKAMQKDAEAFSSNIAKG